MTMILINMVIVILCSMFIGVELAAWTVETSVRVVDACWTSLCIVIIFTRVIDEVRINDERQ